MTIIINHLCNFLFVIDPLCQTLSSNRTATVSYALIRSQCPAHKDTQKVLVEWISNGWIYKPQCSLYHFITQYEAITYSCTKADVILALLSLRKTHFASPLMMNYSAF